MLEQLLKQNISTDLLNKVKIYREKFQIDPEYEYRVPNDQIIYLGKDIWEQAITAILQGENILLVGPKSTGKNLLASNLAQLFKRPSWNVSLNVNSDETQLVGTDTFVDNKVTFRDGPVSLASKVGGFAILDEVNMAKNEALSILHSTLDSRKILDIPGYELTYLHEMTRFIGTMNYGYLGTRELNEALVSRFMVIEMPVIKDEYLKELIMSKYPDINIDMAALFVKLFKDIELKVQNSEISSRALDLRGFLASIASIKLGLDIRKALKMGVSNKTFDQFEKELIDDLIKLNFPKSIKSGDIFNGSN